MIGATRKVRVFAYAAPIDGRKGFNGLQAIVEVELHHDILAGDIFLFVNKRRNRAKALYFDGTGLCLLTKRLERGRFTALWGRDGGAVELTTSELNLFLEGCSLVGKLPLSPPQFTWAAAEENILQHSP